MDIIIFIIIFGHSSENLYKYIKIEIYLKKKVNLINKINLSNACCR